MTDEQPAGVEWTDQIPPNSPNPSLSEGHAESGRESGRDSSQEQGKERQTPWTRHPPPERHPMKKTLPTNGTAVVTALEPELELVARWMALHTVHTIETARLLVQAGRDAGMSPGAIECAAHRHVLGAAITICRASQRPPRLTT